jgi:hypothetical protein
MSYDEEQARRSRVVVETPTERREVVNTSVRTPERSGISAGMVGVLVVVAIALITMLVLFWMSSQPATDTASSMTAAQPTTTVVQQPVPAQQPPVIIQQPAPVTTQPAPVIITPPAGGSTAPAGTSQPANMDSTAQAEIDKHLLEDTTFSGLGITATVINGKVTLLGSVKTADLKDAVERMVRQVKGVKVVDNQITVL